MDIAILLLVLVWQYRHCNTATCIGMAIFDWPLNLKYRATDKNVFSSLQKGSNTLCVCGSKRNQK